MGLTVLWEPTPFLPCWYSHKFNGPGVCYKVGVALQTCNIVWINGPYVCGQFSDVRIVCESLMSHLEPGEHMETDNDYRAEEPLYCKTKSGGFVDAQFDAVRV